MKTKKLITLALAGLMVSSLVETSWAKSPKMKMTTPIPEEITTPDQVKTRIGTLNFKNGMPDQATMDKLWDNLDFSRAVSVYLNALPAMNMYSVRKGPRDAGVPDNTIMTMETMMDSTGMYITPYPEAAQSEFSKRLPK
ncbi:hypothetical protein [Desulforhopalus sp. 52FAK]